MEVDHFDPRQKKDVIQDYENLFLATRHCNLSKGERPTSHERTLGLDFINPCKEWDYGHCIFEDPKTHELWGTNPRAIYHIRYCDLNASQFVTERRRRAELHAAMSGNVSLKPGALFSTASVALKLLEEHVDSMIPLFPMRDKTA